MREKSLSELVNDSSMGSLKRRPLNEETMRRKATATPRVAYTEYVADKLVKIYNAPKSRNFFLKCAWRLPEDVIWSAVEDTRKKGVDTPLALFIFICNNAMQELPIYK